MEVSREVASFLSILLVLLYQRCSLALVTQLFVLRRSRRRRRRLGLIRAIGLAIRQLTAREPEPVARARRSVWVLPRPQLWFQQLLNDRVLDHWWKENFRVSRATFEQICQLVGPVLRRQDTRMRDAIPVEKKVSASLWRLATGECYRSCGLMLGLSKPSVINTCHEFVQELCRIQNDFIKFPNTRADLQKKMEGFSIKSNIPNVVAAIDGSHIPIKAPKLNHEDYFNRKHFYSFVVQGVVDSDCLYLSVSTGYPGSMHDARVLRLSDLFRAAENGEILKEPTLDLNGTVIRPLVVGDSAYPLKTWLLRPFKDNGALSPEHRNFNRQLSKARIVSEHAFGLTKGRWRVLQKRLDEDSDRIPDTIIACCVLHNICILAGDGFEENNNEPDGDEDAEGAPLAIANGMWDAIVDYLENI